MSCFSGENDVRDAPDGRYSAGDAAGRGDTASDRVAADRVEERRTEHGQQAERLRLGQR